MSRDDNDRVEAALRERRYGTGWWRTTCPFCADEGHKDKKASLSVNSATGDWKCFRCGERGRLDEPPDPNAEVDTTPSEIPLFDPPEGFSPIGYGAGAYAESFRDARRYMKKRGISKETIRAQGIGACADGWLAGRIVVPVQLGRFDQWVGWVARLWCNPHPDAEGLAALKYLYPKGMARGTFLYNHDAMLSDETDAPYMTVEGAFDAFQYLPDAGAFFGKPSHAHVRALLEATRPIAVVLDGDAWLEGQMLAMRLRFEGKRAGFVRLPPKTDPNTVDVAWLKEEARRCIDAMI